MTQKALQLPLNLPIEAPFDFENIIVTDSNYPASHLIKQWPNWSSSVALIVGPQGAGKSHFSSIWVQKSNAYRAHVDMLGIAVEEASKGRPILLEDITPQCLDEVGLFHLINAIRQMNSIMPHCSLLMTSSLLPSQWGMKLEDLKSRMRSVTFFEIEQPDDMLLQAILLKLFSDRQLNVEASIISYIMNHMERSLSSAQKIVAHIDEIALQQKAKITRPFVVDVMAKLNK